jgi:hypothetical protein
MTRLLPALALPLVLAACAAATPEARIRDRLVRSGVRPTVAGCMAERMADRLSLSQLARLESLTGLRGRRAADLTVGEFVDHVRALGDPEILAVVSRAGLGCAIAG